MVNYGYVLDEGNGCYTQATAWDTFAPTVTLVGGAGNTVPVYSTNLGRYQKRGTTVFVDVYLTGDGGDEGAGTGVINIALPVTAGSNVNGNGAGITGYVLNGADNMICNGTIAQSADVMSLKVWTSIKVFGDLTGADQDDNARTIHLHFWHEVD